ncbi:hypothetical protein PsorP6_013790 [Peronosclerospora sorghi]|uniref:Uncharacterized protein n=1 Tax=Peronosclerospora sorghi TaxID=230839 RepID=A0ACC0VHV9_9STRA|nr:hypothetical protein PsorP6_013790 [Peronosclerospora sorghi]
MGETVLCERPYGLVVLSTIRALLCAVCLRPADADICCDDCSKVFFCSEECQQRLHHVHEKECDALEEVDAIASKTHTDVDLLRLLVRILAARSLDTVGEHVRMDENGNVQTSYSHVKNLMHILDQEPGQWVDHVRSGVQKIMENLPNECHVPVDEVVSIAARINENSHSLDALDEKHLVAAVGLFPICALINHSCQPNCIYSNGGDSLMEVRALRDITEGEELTLSYIDIDMEREERRKLLRATKHFDCHCKRCSMPLSESIDRYVAGFCCPLCSSTATKENDYLLSENDSQLVCTACQFTVSAMAVHSAVVAGRTKLARAKQSLERFQYPDVVTQLGGLWKGIEVGGQVIPLHPSHGVAIVMARVLCNAHMKLGNIVEACQLGRQVLKALELISWRNHLPLAIAHFDYAEALRHLLVHSSAKEKRKCDELEQDMRASYRAFHDICAVCLGKWHPLRHRAAAALKY